ncbi:hypothetical protein [Mycobacterium paraense]|uniref:hypothetical protein n=1 Tax=Mycobacterium paraense TaxID=767916 RepID=UPI00111BE3D0|nr:hypothetical protein [Mycobacterium paraense]
MTDGTKVINVVITEATTYQRRYRVPDNFDTSNTQAVENLFVHDNDSVDGFVAVISRAVSPVSVSTVPDAAFDKDYSFGTSSMTGPPRTPRSWDGSGSGNRELG